MGYCERPFARGSPPLLAGAGRHRFGANNVVCALALACACPACPLCVGFACFASCRGAASLFCAHTVLLTRLGVGVISVRAGGAALVVGVFARWVGWVWCVRLGCLRFWCWRSGGCAWFVLLWLPCFVACLALTRRVWAALARDGVGRVMGWDNHVPPLQCGCAPSMRAPGREREREGGRVMEW